MHLKKYKNKYIKCFPSDQSSVWTKKQPRIGNQLPHVLAFKDKGSTKRMSKAAHYKLSKSSPKRAFQLGTRKEQKQQAACCVYCN